MFFGPLAQLNNIKKIPVTLYAGYENPLSKIAQYSPLYFFPMYSLLSKDLSFFFIILFDEFCSHIFELKITLDILLLTDSW